MLKPENFFDLSKSMFRDLFVGVEYVWEALNYLKGYLNDNLDANVQVMRSGSHCIEKTTVLHDGSVLTGGFMIDYKENKKVVMRNGQVMEGASIVYAGAYLMDDLIQIGKNSIIEPGALVKGPTIIGDGTEIRHGAYVRGYALIGHNCVVGHTTEMKSSVMLGGSKAGHFAYIGDSILGRVNLGAGTKLANLKLFDSPVILEIERRSYETGLRKVGAVMADGVETGCNSVTMPGTMLGKNVLVYPNATVRGYIPPHTVVKVKPDHHTVNME